ncbi:hypothetical protein [Runella sp.]|uniref:tetratricopeptide repeat protein n=1 Tax=Runella sp. TaxID=1960881 RepID=UPI00262AD7D8|nr:hypothetical protein [Runella sp.]
MAGWIADDKKRNVIPRWRDFTQTLKLGELSPIHTLGSKHSDFIHSEFHKKKIIDWQTERTIKNAIELLNSSYVVDDLEQSHEAALYLNNQKKITSPSVGILAERILEPYIVENSLSQPSNFKDLDSVLRPLVKDLRISINNNLNNSISWVELARLYLILGKERAAERCILVATQLSPDNRYISRIASRFFTHTGDYKKAKQILKSNIAFNVDPWLLGADIGISSLQRKSSFHIKKARELILSKNYSPFELNELLSALATVELNAGSIKNSRKLFNQSLVTPNDNSVAQAVWAMNHINNLNFSNSALDEIPNIYEAKAYHYFNAKQWESTMSNTLQWFVDQPFSRDPAGFGSFIASSILEKYDDAVKLCTYGLKATPNDFTLLNNLAFSLLKMNNVKDAGTVIHKIHIGTLDEKQKAVYLATKGLFMYKNGFSDQGANLYKESSGLAGKIKNKKLQLLSDFHHLSIQLEIDGFPDDKVAKVDQLAKQLATLDEIYLVDLVNNLKRRIEDYRTKL